MRIRTYLLLIGSSLILTSATARAFHAHPVSAHIGSVEPVPAMKKKATKARTSKVMIKRNAVRSTGVRHLVEIGALPSGSVLDQLLFLEHDGATAAPVTPRGDC
jgi:hypothetical protein